MGKRINEEDIKNKKYGRLTAIKITGRSNSGKILWICKCDCGNEITVAQSDFRNGYTKSCGCLQRESVKSRKKPYSHRERLYELWCGIKQRCNNPNNISYKWYGGKGIKVCDEWNNDYLSFKKWASDSGYDETLPRGMQTIERIDTFKDYSPENCTWKTINEQQRNKRNNRLFEHKGEKHTLAEWSEILGIDYTILHSRVLGYGWNIKEAIEKPKTEIKTYEYCGKNMTLREWSKELGVKKATLQYRIRMGKPYDEIFTSEKHIGIKKAEK